MNRAFSFGLGVLASREIHLAEEIFCVSLVDPTIWTPTSFDGPQRRSDVPDEAVIRTVELHNVQETEEIALDADNVTFEDVGPPGRPISAILLWLGRSNPAFQVLLAWIDVAYGFPMRANGGNVTITWDDSYNKIMSLRTTFVQ